MTHQIEPDDVAAGFRCGIHALDDYFARHALANDRASISRAFVLRRSEDDRSALPRVLGFYTLSMAQVEPAQVTPAVAGRKLPRYPLPVALIGRLAVDQRAQGQGLGEKLLLDALKRVAEVAECIACFGIIVDAKNDAAERFYVRYDFVPIEAEKWPRRLFLPIATLRAAFAPDEVATVPRELPSEPLSP
jgi:GNAT superfamily N-acetyltransferase